ncbi:MAG: Ig-like domain-containing protein [Hyphomonadaceae bacterium]|nr:Ig-like domain-containing protein [Hyphomonadaceae bacterium]
MPNSLPTLTVPANLVLPDGATNYLVTGLSVADADDDILTVSLSLSGFLTLGVTDGLIFLLGDGFDDTHMVFSGTVADINAALASLTYTDTGAPGDLEITVSDAGTAPVNFSLAPVLYLRQYDEKTGFVLEGTDSEDLAGRDVELIGDVNDDGIADILISAIGGDDNGADSGEAYVVFGTALGFPETFQLSSLDGTNGFKIRGAATTDALGRTIAGIGDINNDGIEDFAVGARFADPGGRADAGAAYIIFGTDAGFPSALEVTDLDGTNGFVVEGVTAGDRTGRSLAAAGDVNGDGIDDFIVGAPFADPNGGDSGAAYVIYGKATAFSATFDPATLDGTNGFSIFGENSGDTAGLSISSASDINDDGFADIVIGAPGGDPAAGLEGGEAYVVYGGDPLTPANVFLSNISSEIEGNVGFKMSGLAAGDQLGFDVSIAGDFNGDGIDDIVITAPFAETLGVPNSGSAYVIFGTDAGFPDETVDLSALDGTDGFVLIGRSGNGNTGTSVHNAGDINNDGIDDLIIGTPGIDGAEPGAGQTYIVFGSADGFSGTLRFSQIDETEGFTIAGLNLQDASGFAVGGDRDVNGDGIDDIIIGAGGADPNGSASGEAYVIFGGSDIQTRYVSESISVTLENFAPVATDDMLFAAEDGPATTGNVMGNNGNGNDSDANNDVLTVVELNGFAANVGQQITLASGALLTVNSDGTFSYDANGAFEALGTGQTDTDSFTYTISDGQGETATATATVTISGASDPTTITLPGDPDLISTGVVAISGFSLADPDQGDLTVLFSAAGTITLAQTTGLVFLQGDGSDDTVLEFTGTLADINAAIATIDYTPPLGDVVDTISLQSGGTQASIIFGTGTGETLTGSADDADIYGFEGDDELNGGAGDELLVGGLGADTLLGGDGDDTLVLDDDDIRSDINGAINLGGVGTDTLVMEAGSQFITNTLASYGFEIFRGADGNDRVRGNLNSVDYDLDGGAGDDELTGNGGNDILRGCLGSDLMRGNDGNDTIYLDSDDIRSDESGAIDLGGAGYDMLVMEAGSQFVTNGLGAYGFEAFVGADGNDRVRGNVGSVDYELNGGAGDDTLTGNRGRDILMGGEGNDLLDGSGGRDTMFGGAGDDTIILSNADFIRDSEGAALDMGNEGRDTLVMANGSRFITNGLSVYGFEVFIGANRDDRVRGNLANVEYDLDGQGGDDTLTGNNGADRLTGGTGNDTLDGAGGLDRFVFDASHVGTDTVASFFLGETVELTGFGYVSAAEAAADFTQDGGNVVFSNGGVVVTFLSALLSDVVAGIEIDGEPVPPAPSASLVDALLGPLDALLDNLFEFGGLGESPNPDGSDAYDAMEFLAPKAQYSDTVLRQEHHDHIDQPDLMIDAQDWLPNDPTDAFSFIS